MTPGGKATASIAYLVGRIDFVEKTPVDIGNVSLMNRILKHSPVSS